MTNSDCKKITVKASLDYEVLIGSGLIYKAGELISKVIDAKKIAVITDDVVDSLYFEALKNSLLRLGYEVIKYVFANGEKSKNIETYSNILEFLAQNQMTRSSAIIALGGGVVGDVAGFVSATYMRGIKYVQIPTTLLAQIDSSVGGKTAVDLPSGKNLVGAFYQPSLVICDTDTLKSLDDSIYKCGMGEVAKYAILDEKVFELINQTEYDLKELIYRCIDYKRQIVESDEFESGNRKLLNLGHTLAHAVEKISDYEIPHGVAVAIGLNEIVKASFKNGYINDEQKNAMLNAINKCVGKIENTFDFEKLCRITLSDKKRSGNKISLVTVHGLGDCRIEDISVDKVLEFYR